jgi:AcrR family transcriptional regulator
LRIVQSLRIGTADTMVGMSDSGIGLREIKKQLTREAIANAALQLTLDNGFENLTIDEIARLAFVSPRTFSNYFSCKEEAVAAAGSQYWVDVMNRLDERPVGEHPLQSVRTILVNGTRATDDETLQRATQVMKLSRQYPALRPFRVAQYAELEDLARETIARRTGTDAGSDLYPYLTATVAVATMKAAMSTWVDVDGSYEVLPDMIDEAFGELEAGLPVPERSGSESDPED